jgi:hypothetical protein
MKVIVIPDSEEFEFHPSGYDAVTIWYRRLGYDEIEDIDRKFRRVDNRHGRRETYIRDEDQPARLQEITDRSVTRWEGVVDEKHHQPWPCTAENKVKFFLLFPELYQEFLRVRGSDLAGAISENGDGADPTQR